MNVAQSKAKCFVFADLRAVFILHALIIWRDPEMLKICIVTNQPMKDDKVLSIHLFRGSFKHIISK